MTSVPETSVIINCYNGEKYLREAIESVFRQTYQDWEIIFWDNASTDASAGIAKSFGERVRYFRSDVNCNLGTARNLAIRQARGAYIAILDSDDLWLPGKLEAQISCMKANPRVGLTYTDSRLLIDGKVTDHLFSTTYPPHSGKVFEALLTKRDFVVCSAIVATHPVVTQIDSFDGQYQGAEDYDFLLKAALVTEFAFIKEPMVLLRRNNEESFTTKHGDILVAEVIHVIRHYFPKAEGLKVRLQALSRLAQLYAKLMVLNLQKPLK